MKKLLYFIPFLFLSCADPDVDTLTLQSVYAEIEIINCQNSTFNIGGSGGTGTINCSGSNYIHTTNLFQASVIENTSFGYQLVVYAPASILASCIDFTIRVYHNGVLYETKNYSFGILAGLPTIQCANYNMVLESYSIIAN
jgi:hypothetical protein